LAKDNQPGLFDALDALPWQDAPVAHAAADRGHSRITTRTIQVLPAPDNLPFPHVSQAYLIERHVTGLDGTPLSDIAALGVTSPGAPRRTEPVQSLDRPLAADEPGEAGPFAESFCNTSSWVCSSLSLLL
jgi:hypothetical protein